MAYREKINEAVRKWLETYQRPPELEIPPKYDVKGLARAVKGERPTKRKNSPQVYLDELEKPIETVIAEEAQRIYKKVTGKRKVPEELPPIFYEKAMIEILKRWQKTAKELYEGLKPTLEALEKPEEKLPPAGAPRICPRCGVVMEEVFKGNYVCPKCGYHMRV